VQGARREHGRARQEAEATAVAELGDRVPGYLQAGDPPGWCQGQARRPGRRCAPGLLLGRATHTPSTHGGMRADQGRGEKAGGRKGRLKGCVCGQARRWAARRDGGHRPPACSPRIRPRAGGQNLWAAHRTADASDGQHGRHHRPPRRVPRRRTRHRVGRHGALANPGPTAKWTVTDLTVTALITHLPLNSRSVTQRLLRRECGASRWRAYSRGTVSPSGARQPGGA